MTKWNSRPTVNAVWGSGQAINASLALSCMARLSLLGWVSSGNALESSLETLCILEKAVITISYGQYVDLLLQSSSQVHLQDYLPMAENKTGALFGAACEAGAVVSQLPSS